MKTAIDWLMSDAFPGSALKFLFLAFAVTQLALIWSAHGKARKITVKFFPPSVVVEYAAKSEGKSEPKSPGKSRVNRSKSR